MSHAHVTSLQNLQPFGIAGSRQKGSRSAMSYARFCLLVVLSLSQALHDFNQLMTQQSGTACAAAL